MVVTVRTAKKIRKAYFTAHLFLFTLITFLYYLNIEISTKPVIEIPRGSINGFFRTLEKDSYDVTKLDTIIIRFMGSPQSGWIDIGKEKIKKGDFLHALVSSKAAMREIKIIPGETTIIALEEVGQKLGLNGDKLWDLYKLKAPFKEGYIVPNTYKVPIGIDEEGLIDLLLKRSNIFHKNLSVKVFGSYNSKKWLHLVTLASVIQKEAANKKEMALVSSVIYNRLKKRMKLQMDGTLNYGKYSHIKITPKRIREDKSSYNTYKHYGLPKNPVCMVQKEAILAAIYPAKTDYLYFMKNKDGVHDFTRSYNTHLRNIRKKQKSVYKRNNSN
ncbi:MAG: endolytic transglycosylase MltG [Campylobacterales bacterium]|nr:endolytic transglycosylase MltG [Campylobacterales bacterium]